MNAQPLFITLISVQFMIHALGWAMVAHLARRWPLAEGHFAGCWLLLAAGLLLYVPSWPSGSMPRNLASFLIVASVALQHRGMALYWEQRPNDRGYALLLAERIAARIASTGQPRVTVSIGLAVAHAQTASVDEVIRQADAALYRAKEAGRNRVIVAEAALALAPTA